MIHAPMDGKVKTHKLCEFFVSIIAQHAGEVGRPIEFWVNCPDSLSVMVGVAVDGGSNDWELGNQVHAVFVDVFPVLALVNTLKENFFVSTKGQEIVLKKQYLRVSLSVFAFVIQSSDSSRKL